MQAGRDGAVCLNHQGRIVTIGPFTHRPIVITHAVVTQQLQDKQSVRRTDAALSIGDDFFVGRNARRLQHSA
jgi:hypothetical protein